jgi:hypothetical protein
VTTKPADRGLLGARRQRPHCGRAAEHRDELAATDHLITAFANALRASRA